MESFDLKKWKWTELDFEKMGWHDSTVYGMKLDQNLTLDIDYILKWNNPELEGFQYTFWIAPATLIFKDIKNLEFEFSQSLYDNWLEIDYIENQNGNEWVISLQQGAISFNSNSYEQIIKMIPSFQLGQIIPYDERGGFNFDTTPGNEVETTLSDTITERRNRDLELYEIAKKRHMYQLKLDELKDSRNQNKIDTADYLRKKRKIKEWVDSLTFQLKGSQFEVRR